MTSHVPIPQSTVGAFNSQAWEESYSLTEWPSAELTTGEGGTYEALMMFSTRERALGFLDRSGIASGWKPVRFDWPHLELWLLAAPEDAVILLDVEDDGPQNPVGFYRSDVLEALRESDHDEETILAPAYRFRTE